MAEIIRPWKQPRLIARSEVAKVLGFRVSDRTLRELERKRKIHAHIITGAISLDTLEHFNETLTEKERANMKAEELAYVALEENRILSYQVSSVIESAKKDYGFTKRITDDWENGAVKGFKPTR